MGEIMPNAQNINFYLSPPSLRCREPTPGRSPHLRPGFVPSIAILGSPGKPRKTPGISR